MWGGGRSGYLPLHLRQWEGRERVDLGWAGGGTVDSAWTSIMPAPSLHSQGAISDCSSTGGLSSGRPWGCYSPTPEKTSLPFPTTAWRAVPKLQIRALQISLQVLSYTQRGGVCNLPSPQDTFWSFRGQSFLHPQRIMGLPKDHMEEVLQL